MDKGAGILVTDPAGMTGSALVRKLRAAGYANLALPEGDFRNQEAALACFRAIRPDMVFFMGGRSGGIEENRRFPANLVQDNLLVQAHLFEAAQHAGVRRLIYLASACVYPRDCPQPMREEHLLSGPPEPTNDAYAVAKLAGIFQCLAMNRQHGTRYLPVIPTNIYGPGDEMDPARAHVVGALLARMHAARESREPLKVWGTGAPRREFIHADALVFLMQRDPDPGVMNVASGEELSVKALAGLIREVVGFQGEIVFDASRPDGAPCKILDGSLLRALGWRPRIPLAQGLRSTYAWHRAR